MLFLTLLGVSACTAQGDAVQYDVSQDARQREQQLAQNDVWHAAKLRGVAFRAIGQEPGWLLEIKNGEEILIVTDYGQKRSVFAWVEPVEDRAARSTLFELDAGASVLIEGEPCTDSMSGEQFETTVTVETGSRSLKGCGRALY